MSDLNFLTFSYADLNKDQLYKIFELRQAVFVVEQDCVYQDIDGKDSDCLHVVGTSESNEVLAYARLVPNDLSFPKHVSVGRVATAKRVRGTGAGKALMQFCMQELKRLWPNDKVKIQAQTYLLDFYREFGFEVIGEEYLEDDIPHTDMVLSVENS